MKEYSDKIEDNSHGRYRFEFMPDKDMEEATLIVRIELFSLPEEELKGRLEREIGRWVREEAERLGKDTEYLLEEQFRKDHEGALEGEIFLWEDNVLEVGPSEDLVRDSMTLVRLLGRLDDNEELPIERVRVGSGYEW